MKSRLSPFIFVLLVACTPTPPSTQPVDSTAAVTSTTSQIPTRTQPAPVPGSLLAPTRTLRPPNPAETLIPTSTPHPTIRPPVEHGGAYFEQLAHIGGAANTVALLDNIAYVGVGPRVLALDISDPTNPISIAQSPVLWGLVTSLIIDDEIAYAGISHGMITLSLDADNFLMPLGSAQIFETQRRMSLAGDRLIMISDDCLYNLDCDSTLTVLDVSNPVEPRRADFVTIPGFCNGMVIAGDFLFVLTLDDIRIYELSAEGRIEQRGVLPDVVDPQQIALDGSILYVLAAENGVLAFDITRPTDPLPLPPPAEPLPQFVWADNLLADAGRLYVRSGYGDVGIFHVGFDVLELDSQTVTASSPTVTSSSRFAVRDGIIYSAEGYVYSTDPDVAFSGLNIYDAADPDNIPLIGQYATMRAFDAAVYGGVAYVADGGNRLYAVNIADPTRPVVIGEYHHIQTCDTCRTALFGVDAGGGFAYAYAWDGGVAVVDVRDPLEPELATLIASRPEGADNAEIGFYDFALAEPTGVMNALRVRGSASNWGLTVFDVFNPYRPREAGFLPVPGERDMVQLYEGLGARDGLAYIALQISETGALEPRYEVRLADISDPDRPRWLGGVDIPGRTVSVTPVNDSLALAAWHGDYYYGVWGGIVLIATDSPINPQIVSILEIPDGVWDVAAIGDQVAVLVAGGGEGSTNGRLYAVDLSNPANPRVMTTAALPAGYAKLTTVDNLVLAADSYGGLYIFRLKPGDPY